MKTLLKKQYISVIVTVIVIFFIIYFTFFRSTNASIKPVETPLVNVNVFQVKAIQRQRYIEAIGSLSPHKKVDISPQIAGQVQKIKFHYGDSIQKGQLLYQLDDSLYLAKLEAAQSNLAFSKITYERLLKLADKDVISKQMLDKAKSSYEDAESKLKIISVELDKNKILAPFSGVISASKVDIGQYVKVGESLTSLVDKENLIVKFSIPQDNLNQIAKNQIVSIEANSLPNKIFNGNVIYISPSVDPKTRTVMVWANVPNHDNQLAPGLFVSVKLFIGSENAILISQEALIPTVEGNNVFVIENGKAYQKSVTIGQRVDDKIVILKGLNTGDVVVVKGQEKLANGRSVRVL